MKRIPLYAFVAAAVVACTALMMGCEGEVPSAESHEPVERAREAMSATDVEIANFEGSESTKPVFAESSSGVVNIKSVAESGEPSGSDPAGATVPEGHESARRWAIISSEQLQQNGFPDLITSVLADAEGVQLVERDQLDSVLAELDLARVQSPDGGKERQRLSVLLGAQRLLLLDGTIWNSRGTVAVQVVDTYSGVHLFRGHLKIDESNTEAAAQRLCRLVRDVESKYVDGIRAVVGIPYFVSENLNEEYASLQEEFASTLAAAVKVAPGVAVLSFKEAQLIQNEMLVSGHSIRRFLPVFVTGKYEIYEREENDKQRLRLSVAVTDGSEAGETIEEDQVTLQEATEVLKTRAAQLVLDLLSRPSLLPLTREQQEAALAKRADELAKAGEILKAIELRETALLISPNNPRHRIQIFLDREKGGADFRDVEAVYPHLEYLFRNRLVDISWGCGLVAEIPKWIRARYWRGVSRVSGEHGNEIPLSKFNDPRTFLLDVFPQLLRLPPPESGGGRYLNLDFKGAPVSPDRQRAEYGGPTAIIIDELLRHPYDYRKAFPDDFAMLIQQMPQDVLLVVHDWTPRTYLQYLSKQEVLAACQKTRTNGTARDAFIADYLEFMIHLEADWDNLTEGVCDEFARLEQSLDSLKNRKTNAVLPYYAQDYDKTMAAIREKLAARFERTTIVSKHAYPQIKSPLPLAPEAPIEIEASMSIDWINDWPLHIDTEPTVYLTRPGLHLTQLDQKTDVVWNHSTVYLLTRSPEGDLIHRQIYQVSQNEGAIFSIRADESNVWLANTAQQIVVLSRNGKKLAEFESGRQIPSFVSPMRALGMTNGKGYPKGISLPHVRPSQPWQAQVREQAGQGGLLNLALYPLAPGKCLACGREGRVPDTWVALLSFDRASGKSKAEVLHRAGRACPTGNLAGLSSPENIDICFSVPWICVWQDPGDPNDRVAIVGRSHDCEPEYRHQPNMPLAVDLQTKKVTTLAERIPGLARVRGGVSAACVNGSLVIVEADKTVVWHWQRDGSFERIDAADSPTQDYFLIQIGSRIYSPGTKWLAIDVGDQAAVNTIAERMEPDHTALDRYAASACFQIWASGSRNFAPYAIDPGTSSRKSVSPFARFVPPSRLESHTKAVQAIRELGGRVGTADYCHKEIYMGFDASLKKRCTAVCLDEDWQGGDAGLCHLSGLSDLKIVFLLNADVSATGVRQVLQSDSITALALAHMPLDRDAFQTVARLPQLQALFLDLKPGGEGELGDDCLSLLSKSKHLELLSLHGPAFTDRCLPSLKTLKKVHGLHLWGTSISLCGGDTGRDGRSLLQQLRKGK